MNSRTQVWVFGLALIVVTNVIALGGALYNRSGQPEALLALTERELMPPYRWGWREENSGLSLRLLWRTATDHEDPYFTMYGREAAWLGKDKLAALGFELRYEPKDDEASRYYTRQLSRDAFVVLELDGPAYAAAVDAAQRRLAQAEAEAPRDPDAERGKDTLRSARDGLLREREKNSRLFAIDVAPDRATLRAKYPDTTRYAIVRGHVGISICHGPERTAVCGHIDDLEVPTINVPFEHRSVFDGVEPARNVRHRDDDAVRFNAAVAFGRRLEPWLVSADRTRE